MILPSLSIVPYAHNRAGNMFTQFPLDGGFTVSSSDQGTIVNADGIIERSPRNLCINTQNFTAGSWAQTGAPTPTVINNVELAPDGTMTAALMTNGQIQYAAGIGVVGKEYTCSLYIRRISGTGTVRFRAIENANTPVSVTSEWQRFSLTVAATTATLRIGINLELGTNTVAIWGAQIEESLTPTAYQRVDASRLNFPRIDWFGQSCPGLLVEPAATNFARWVNQMTAQDTPTASGGMTITTGSTDFLAPDGTSGSITKYVGGAASGASQYAYYTGGAITVTASGQHTFSLFVKRGATNPLTFCGLGIENYAGGSGTTISYFNLASGTALTAGASVQDYGNGWYRLISAPYTLAAGDLTGQLAFYMAEGNLDISWPASGALGLTAYTWGAQFEAGSNATSYIPTTTTTASRAADVISASGALVSGLIGQTEGTMYFEVSDVKGVGTGTGNPALSIRDTATTNWIGLISNNTALPFRIQVKSTTTTLINYTSAITEGKAAIAYSASGAVVYVNGLEVASTATNPNLTLNIVTMQQYMPFKVESLALYTTRLDNYELMAMTSLDTSYEQLAARLSYAT